MPAVDRRKYAGKAKQPKNVSASDQIKRKYTTLSRQISGSHYANAEKTCQQILRIDPQDALAHKTRLQLELAQEHYKAVTTESTLTDNSISYERAYALYKCGQEREALKVIESVEPAQVSRGLKVLEAQIRYKIEDYKTSKDLYQELLYTTEDLDSPEYADLENNLAACDAYLEFEQSIPSQLSTLQSEGVLPSFHSLESTVIGPLVASRFKSKIKPSNLPTSIPTSTSSHSKKRKRKTVLPPHIAKLAPEDRPEIDPERWLPKRERKEYKEALAEKMRQKELQEKKAEKFTVQGAGGNSSQKGGATSSGNTSTGKTASSSASKKKKKGGKK